MPEVVRVGGAEQNVLEGGKGGEGKDVAGQQRIYLYLGMDEEEEEEEEEGAEPKQLDQRAGNSQASRSLIHSLPPVL